MASLTAANVLSSHVIQNTSAQDVALSGSTAEFDWLLVADGHGSGSNKYLLKKLFLENIDWSILLTNPDFYKDDKNEDGNYINELYDKIQKVSRPEAGRSRSKLVAQGTTLSVVKIYPDRFECYHIGDSTVKIYESNEKNYNKVMETHDHDSNHPDMEALTQRTSEAHPCRRNWYHGFTPLSNGIRTKNVLTPHVLNETTVTMRKSAYITFDDGSVINMTRSLGHIPSTGTIAKAEKNNHALSLAQQSLTKTTFQRDSNKSYCVLAATDGVWDMVCDEDDVKFANIISTKGEAATEIATFARKRWLQEWNYCFKNLTQKIIQSEGNIDDIGVSCAFVQ